MALAGLHLGIEGREMAILVVLESEALEVGASKAVSQAASQVDPALRLSEYLCHR